MTPPPLLVPGPPAFHELACDEGELNVVNLQNFICSWIDDANFLEFTIHLNFKGRDFFTLARLVIDQIKW